MLLTPVLVEQMSPSVYELLPADPSGMPDRNTPPWRLPR